MPKTYPFDYAADEGAELARYIAQPAQPPEIARWAAGFLRAGRNGRHARAARPA